MEAIDMTSDEMSTIIAMVKANDLEKLNDLVRLGADVDVVDEHGWTALCWAASRGNTAAVDLLCHAGANVFKTGEDQRTPYKIALAASHRETARRLRDLEEAAGSDRARVSSRESEGRLYCKAYRVADLRRFPQWDAMTNNATLAPEDIVFVHQNYAVTRSIWHDKEVVAQNAPPEWRVFCDADLAFKMPDDLDLITI
jgi:ankyrin repeat protein